MSNAAQLRDSTQLVLTRSIVDALEPPLDEEFTVTIVPEGDDHYRVIGSPVEINAASDSLARRGVALE